VATAIVISIVLFLQLKAFYFYVKHSENNNFRSKILILLLLKLFVPREMDGLGSPEGLMDPSMMDLRYHGQGTPGCYSPKLSYQPFQPNAWPGTQYTPRSLWPPNYPGYSSYGLSSTVTGLQQTHAVWINARNAEGDPQKIRESSWKLRGLRKIHETSVFIGVVTPLSLYSILGIKEKWTTEHDV
jgi:hypothetical protein